MCVFVCLCVCVSLYVCFCVCVCVSVCLRALRVSSADARHVRRRVRVGTCVAARGPVRAERVRAECTNDDAGPRIECTCEGIFPDESPSAL